MQWSETEKYGCRSWCWQQCCAFFHLIFKRLFQRRQKMLRRNVQGGEEQKPKIALTFDDGPNIKYTPMLLDGLKERGDQSNIFSDRSKHRTRRKQKNRKKNVWRRSFDRNHTYRHVDLSKISGREAEKEIKTTDEAIKRSQDMRRNLSVRRLGQCPEGEEDPDKIYVKWTVDSLDWVTKDTEKNCRESNGRIQKKEM